MDDFPEETKLNICKDLLRMNYLQYSPKLLITVYVTISGKKKKNMSVLNQTASQIYFRQKETEI